MLGRPPDLVPAEGVYEWRLAAGAWLQLLAGEDRNLMVVGDDDQRRSGGQQRRPAHQRRRTLPQPQQRFTVDGARAALDAAGARVVEVTTIPDVVAFCDVEDPFGNGLSLYEDLTE